MSHQNQNSCARCGVPIPHTKDLCEICAQDATNRLVIVPCVACGAANPANLEGCESCGAPLAQASATDAAEFGIDFDSMQPKARKDQLQVMEEYLNICLERGIVGGALVTGEIGMGVSTLLDAFCDRLRGRLLPNRIYHVHCRREDDLFGPIRGVLRQRFQLLVGENPIVSRTKFLKIVSNILGHASTALVTETAHLLGYLANMPFPDSPVLRALGNNNQLLLKRMKEAIVRFITADAKDGPIAFIFDSVHRVTEEGRDFHLNLFESLGEIPVFVVGGGNVIVDGIQTAKAIVPIALEKLDDEIMGNLFAEYLPALPNPPEDLVDATISRANGNPGSLKQLCALLTESGIVVTTTQPWSVNAEKFSMEDMPVNVMDALKARLRRLDPRDMSVLTFASIIGEAFWDEAIVALTRQNVKLKKGIRSAQIWADDSDGFAISSSLERLVERQFIVRLSDMDIPGALKFAFARSRIRVAIEREIGDDERQILHRLVAQWFAQASQSVGPKFTELEAYHWEASGELHHAALAYLSAARYARSRYLNQKAIRLFNRGLELIDTKDRLVIIDALHDLGSVQELLGSYEDAEECFTEMLKHAWILVHRSKAGAALNKIGRIYRSRGDSTASRAFLERAMALFKAANDVKGIAACLGDLGELARRQGTYDRAFKLVSQALELQRRLDNKQSIAVCLQSLGHIEASRASYTQGERYLEEALSIRQAAGDKGGMAQTLSALAIVLLNRGDLERAVARWEAALNLAVEVGDRRMVAICHNNLGEAKRDRNKLQESLAHFTACEEMVTNLDDRLLHSEVLRNMGILYLRMNRHQEAKEQLDKALFTAQEIGGKELEGLALRGLGELNAATLWDTSNVGAEDNAAVYFRKAIDVFQKVGNDYEIARTQHAYGTRLLERGKLEEGRAQLKEAEAVFSRINSPTSEKVGFTIEEIDGQLAESVPPPPPMGKGKLGNVFKRKK